MIPEQTKKPANVVVLGAGFGGLAVVSRLASHQRREEIKLTFIDRNDAHIYTPLLYEVATGFLDYTERKCTERLSAGVSISLHDYARALPAPADFIRGEIIAIDRVARVVILADKRSVSYDYLVIALGSSADDCGIAGVRQYAFAMKCLTDALAIRARLRVFVEAHLKNRKEQIAVVICGGGATGVELATELGSFFERLRRHEIIRHRHATITLIEVGATILAPFDMTLRRLAENRLRALGVDILTETKVKEVKKNCVLVVDDKQNENSKITPARTICADAVIWTAGIRASKGASYVELPLDSKGRIVVGATLRPEGEERIFALGDSAFYLPPGRKQPVPTLAQVAVREGRIVADNILASVRGDQLFEVSLSKHWSMILPLGGKLAMAQIGRWQFCGRMAYLLRKIIDFYYLATILPLSKAFKLWWQGLLTYIKND